MILKTKNNKQVVIRLYNPDDVEALYDYFQRLSPETKKRFGPHSFDKQSIIEWYKSSVDYFAFVALEMETNKIVAYAIIKIGYLEHDSHRLRSYGIKPDQKTDCTFTPSVADDWQGMGIGNMLLQCLISALKTKGVKRIILWGGVQMENDNAVHYYLHNGFVILGQFSYNGENYDMALDIN